MYRAVEGAWECKKTADVYVKGVKQIHASPMDAHYVFIAPPSMTVLEERLRGRGTETEDKIQQRLKQAEKEMAYSSTPGVHDLVIVNDDLETAYAELEKYVVGTTTKGE